MPVVSTATSAHHAQVVAVKRGKGNKGRTVKIPDHQLDKLAMFNPWAVAMQDDIGRTVAQGVLIG